MERRGHTIISIPYLVPCQNSRTSNRIESIWVALHLPRKSPTHPPVNLTSQTPILTLFHASSLTSIFTLDSCSVFHFALPSPVSSTSFPMKSLWFESVILLCLFVVGGKGNKHPHWGYLPLYPLMYSQLVGRWVYCSSSSSAKVSFRHGAITLNLTWFPSTSPPPAKGVRAERSVQSRRGRAAIRDGGRNENAFAKRTKSSGNE